MMRLEEVMKHFKASIRLAVNMFQKVTSDEDTHEQMETICKELLDTVGRKGLLLMGLRLGVNLDELQYSTKTKKRREDLALCRTLVAFILERYLEIKLMASVSGDLARMVRESHQRVEEESSMPERIDPSKAYLN